MKFKALINILMNINNYTINDMIYNMNQFIQNQSIINEKVNLLQKKKFDVFVFPLLFYLEKTKLYYLVSSISFSLFRTTKKCFY